MRENSRLLLWVEQESISSQSGQPSDEPVKGIVMHKMYKRKHVNKRISS